MEGQGAGAGHRFEEHHDVLPRLATLAGPGLVVVAHFEDLAQLPACSGTLHLPVSLHDIPSSQNLARSRGQTWNSHEFKFSLACMCGSSWKSPRFSKPPFYWLGLESLERASPGAEDFCHDPQE